MGKRLRQYAEEKIREAVRKYYVEAHANPTKRKERLEDLKRECNRMQKLNITPEEIDVIVMDELSRMCPPGNPDE